MRHAGEQLSSPRIREPLSSARNLYEHNEDARKMATRNLQAVIQTSIMAFRMIVEKNGYSARVAADAENGKRIDFHDFERLAKLLKTDALTLLSEDVARRVSR